jgi:hypothetical protein
MDFEESGRGQPSQLSRLFLIYEMRSRCVRIKINQVKFIYKYIV